MRKLGIDIRNDLIANLGGEFLFALDGPVLPTPSWKAVIEVRDSDAVRNDAGAAGAGGQQSGSRAQEAHQVAIDPSDASGQRFYAVHDVTSRRGGGGVHVCRRVHDHCSDAGAADGSAADARDRQFAGAFGGFKALLPEDQNENYSAVAYQNLGPVLTPLLSQLSGESADAISKLAADSHPTAICAWGKERGSKRRATATCSGSIF